jgi:hypothetical protein
VNSIQEFTKDINKLGIGVAESALDVPLKNMEKKEITYIGYRMSTNCFLVD